MSEKSIISLCCEECNDSIEFSSDDIEKEVPKFKLKHPNCELVGYINGRVFSKFGKIKPVEQKWLN
jgi:hypothetical protein